MVAELIGYGQFFSNRCSLAKISMLAEHCRPCRSNQSCCSLAKISMVAEHISEENNPRRSCSLAKISMVAEPQNI